jgi:hypothetical protein
MRTHRPRSGGSKRFAMRQRQSALYRKSCPKVRERLCRTFSSRIRLWILLRWLSLAPTSSRAHDETVQSKSFHPSCISIFHFAENFFKRVSEFGPQNEIARHGAVVRRTTKPAMTVLRDISDPGWRLRQCFRRQFGCDLRSRFEGRSRYT